MSEPPRPPGDDNAGSPADPTRPMPFGSDPSSGYTPPPSSPPPGSPPPPPPYSPPASGPPAYQPPVSGGGYTPPSPGFPQPPTSGAGGYPPGGGAPPPYGTPGYDQPQQGYDPNQQGYGTPGYGTPGYSSGGYPTSDDRTWALLAHFGGAVGAFLSGGPLGFVGPLIAYLAKGDQSPTVRAHALAALNFQLLWSAIAFVTYFVSWCLLFIPSLIIFGIQVVIGVIAGIKAANGEPYRYPMSVNWIK
jgi:uncharacterized Tic20 family protein